MFSMYLLIKNTCLVIANKTKSPFLTFEKLKSLRNGKAETQIWINLAFLDFCHSRFLKLNSPYSDLTTCPFTLTKYDLG